MTTKTLFKGKFVSVLLRDDWYEYWHAESGGIVYVLVYRTEAGEKNIMGRFEVCPAHDDKRQELTSLTGSVPVGALPLDIAVEEMYEEAGYIVEHDALQSLGQVRLSKAQDTIAHLYAVDVTDVERGEAPGDGSFGEIGSYCDWVSREDALLCKCPIVATMIARLENTRLILT